MTNFGSLHSRYRYRPGGDCKYSSTIDYSGWRQEIILDEDNSSEDGAVTMRQYDSHTSAKEKWKLRLIPKAVVEMDYKESEWSNESINKTTVESREETNPAQFLNSHIFYRP